MSARTLSNKLTAWFEHTHDNPPAAFNPAYVPCTAPLIESVIQSMLDDRYYDAHPRIECAAEFQRRYHELRRAIQEPPPDDTEG